MMLGIMIDVLILGGVAAWVAAKWDERFPRWISLAAVSINLVIAIGYCVGDPPKIMIGGSEWIEELSLQWIPGLGISFHLAMDGLSLLMLLLTFFLGILAVLTSWKEIQYRVGFYHFNLLWVLAGITGVFLTMDFFLFYFFWEVMLIPMFFLIVIWGHEDRRYAGYKFFIFTQASGLLMLVAILALYFVNGSLTGNYTFDYFQLLGVDIPASTAKWIMLGFLAAFIVKLPVVPFHTWLPDAHSQAPTAGSLILAGLLLKTGAYGLLRFIIPLFYDAAVEIAPWAMLLGVVGILYGAVLAFAQTDIKRLVAYTSVSHMGFIMLGVFSFNELAFQGVVMQMITHGISTGALFILAGFVYERIHTRDLSGMGGFWPKMPFMAATALVFAMASLGLPGLGNFVAEFLTLLGSWQANKLYTILATVGLVAATVYSLRIMQRVFYGPEITSHHDLADLGLREKLMMTSLVVVIIWLGLFPQPVLRISADPVTTILSNRPRTEATNKVPAVQPETNVLSQKK